MFSLTSVLLMLQESLRYQTHATSVLTTIATIVGMFEEIKTFRSAFYQQGDFHRGREITAYHCRVGICYRWLLFNEGTLLCS